MGKVLVKYLNNQVNNGQEGFVMMYTFSVNVPDAVLFDTHMNAENSASCIRKAAALYYYTKMGVSLGYCAEIAEMQKVDFIRFLSENGISIFEFEDMAELERDIANA